MDRELEKIRRAYLMNNCPQMAVSTAQGVQRYLPDDLWSAKVLHCAKPADFGLAERFAEILRPTVPDPVLVVRPGIPYRGPVVEHVRLERFDSWQFYTDERKGFLVVGFKVGQLTDDAPPLGFRHATLVELITFMSACPSAVHDGGSDGIASYGSRRDYDDGTYLYPCAVNLSARQRMVAEYKLPASADELNGLPEPSYYYTDGDYIGVDENTCLRAECYCRGSFCTLPPLYAKDYTKQLI